MSNEKKIKHLLDELDAEVAGIGKSHDLEEHFEFFMKKCGHKDLAKVHPTQLREMKIAFYGGVGQTILLFSEIDEDDMEKIPSIFSNLTEQLVNSVPK